MAFNDFDSIRIINLRHRADRRADMIKELRKVGLEGDPRVAFFKARTFDEPGTFRSKGERGVYASHLELLQQAAATGQSVLIFEDDLDFAADAPRFRLPADWSIFYGSYEASNPGNLQGSDIIGAHFMGFKADAASLVARYLESLLSRPDQPPIDGAYVWFRRAHPEVRTVFAEPKLGNQRPSRTDIAPLRFFDRVPFLKQIASFVRRLKRAIGWRSRMRNRGLS